MIWNSGRKATIKPFNLKISQLINDICEHPFTGIGKPEALRYEFSGLWSRRINNEHRIIYELFDNQINVISIKGHYRK
jgi:toxin YoeB